MASDPSEPTPEGDSAGDSQADRQALVPDSKEQSFPVAPDAFADFEGFEIFMKNFEPFDPNAQFPTDEELPVAPPAGNDTERVMPGTGDSDASTSYVSVKSEPSEAQTGIDERIPDVEMREEPAVASGKPSSPTRSPQTGLSPQPGLGPSRQDAGRPLDLGASTLERQRAQQNQLAAQFTHEPEISTPVPPDVPTPSADLVDTMPPPAPLQSEDAELAQEYKRIKALYKTKKSAGTLDTTLDIEWIKVQSRYNAYQRKLAVDRLVDEAPSPDAESGLFVDQQAPSQIEYTAYSGADDDDDDGDDEEEDNRPTTRAQKRKFVDQIDDETMATVSTALPKPATSRKKSKKDATAGEEDIAGSAASKKKGKAKTKNGRAKPRARQQNPSLTNVRSVFGTNVFKDFEQNRDLENQPTFHGTKRKDDALKQLIASVPIENRRIAATDKRFLDIACKTFDGTGAVKAGPDGNWIVKGMRSTLKHYQVLGAAFMRKREHEDEEPRGGILADEMGLGKTVMMLANIVNGKPQKGDSKCTLIVASPALCNQWMGEITKHTLSRNENQEFAKRHGLGKVVQHRAGHRVGNERESAHDVIAKANICLTTYQEICKSYPRAIVPVSLTTAAQKDRWWKEYYEENKGIFHQIDFHRVVLDEAQAIKNHKSHTSLACRAIKATYHWAITGTPIMNRLTEFYPYFKFLREPHTGSFKIFSQNFCTLDDPEGTARLAVFLRKIMIRRTHLDTLFGARLLDLPRPKQTVVWLSFNETERQIYEIVKNRFIQRINTIAKKEGGVVKSYNSIWTMILRLRQLCAHILLIQDTIVDLLEREDYEKLNAICKRSAAEGGTGSILVHLRAVLHRTMTENEDTAEAGAGGVGAIIPATETAAINAGDYTDNYGNLAGNKHGQSFDFGKYMQNLTESRQFEEIQERATCCACRQPPDQPHITTCFHIYCLSCINDLQHRAARLGRPRATCDECGAEYANVEPCAVNSAQPDTASPADWDSDDFFGRRKRSKKKKKDMNDWIGMKGEILPSTKTIACKAQILEWLAQDKRCKIIVYTQFMPVIRIMEKVCRSELWTYVSYQGNMSQSARDNAIKRFEKNVECNIMLMSLRCGGLGLNLTMAQHVILIDPWWNSAVEQQAFCRVFRIGQTKETHMTRFVVENTIDASMMTMKERKENEIDEVMENPRLREKLSMDELLRMFGPVGRDESGRPFIFAEGGGEDHERFREEDEDEDDGIVNDY